MSCPNLLDFDSSIFKYDHKNAPDCDIKELENKVFSMVVANDEVMRLVTEDHIVYEFYHSQDCCEGVEIEDIEGDLNDLVGTPILAAVESSSEGEPKKGDDWATTQWTFYKFATIKGYVDVRWYGISNGYYSTDVSLRRYKLPDNWIMGESEAAKL